MKRPGPLPAYGQPGSFLLDKAVAFVREWWHFYKLCRGLKR